MPLSRIALAVVLACCLVASGCLVCFDLSFVDGVPDLESILEQGPPCLSPLDFLFVVLYAIRYGELDDGYTPPIGLSAAPTRILQSSDESGLYSLTYGLGGAAGARRIRNEIRSLHAVVEPYFEARQRYFDGETPPPAPRRIFLSDAAGDSVAVFDPVVGDVVQMIRVGSSPRGMAFAPDGGRMYVANHDSASVAVVDLETLTRIDLIGLPGGDPEGLAMAPDGSRLYVVNSATSGELIVIDPATGEVTQTLRAGREPTHVRLSPDGAAAYVLNSAAGTIMVVDTQTLTAISNIPVPAVADLVVSADGQRLYAVGGGTLGKAFEIDAASFQTVREWELGDTPQSVTLTPDGLYLLISNFGSDFSSLVPLFGGEVISVPAIAGLGPVAVAVAEAE